MEKLGENNLFILCECASVVFVGLMFDHRRRRLLPLIRTHAHSLCSKLISMSFFDDCPSLFHVGARDTVLSLSSSSSLRIPLSSAWQLCANVWL